MNRHFLLDSTPLGLLSSTSSDRTVIAINQWSRNCLAAGHTIYIPEVIDYELRRELIRSGKVISIQVLDGLKRNYRYIPITTSAMMRAANLWAYSRNSGIPTGDPKKLDVDVILCAQALSMTAPAAVVTVVTDNVRHISRFVAAAEWTSIIP